MSYKLEFVPQAVKQLKKLDKYQAALISRWLYQNIDGIENPRKSGKALSGNKASQWRYHIRNYRAIVEIEDDCLVVLAIQIGHRKNIYL